MPKETSTKTFTFFLAQLSALVERGPGAAGTGMMDAKQCVCVWDCVGV